MKAEVLDELKRFVAERDWSQFHSPKNLVMALSGEVGELTAEFQWLTQEESHQASEPSDLRDRVKSELADVTIYLTLLSEALGIDLDDAVAAKLSVNKSRFPKQKRPGPAS